jgi:prolyl-tRNA synthetase
VRVRLDDQVATAFGRRATDWELKGVPLRIELGPRDLAEGRAVVVRRDTSEKLPHDVEGLASVVPELLEQVQHDLHAEALTFREQRTTDCTDVESVADAAATGFARIPWAALDASALERLGRDALTVRCVQTAEGDVPESLDAEGNVAVVARAY